MLQKLTFQPAGFRSNPVSKESWAVSDLIWPQRSTLQSKQVHFQQDNPQATARATVQWSCSDQSIVCVRMHSQVQPCI